MTIWSGDLTRDVATTETSDAIFGFPPFIAFVTLAIPVIPLIANLLGSGTIEGLGIWFMGVDGWVWIGGYALLIVLQVVSYAREIVKHIAAKR
ncbi:MAG: hypothetical protein O7G13_05160 [Alphaproteobacteria bacterium]|nr:hypothetical protein [Alphaproteobacteria bacterium]